jgi:hypothetical protein
VYGSRHRDLLAVGEQISLRGSITASATGDVTRRDGNEMAATPSGAHRIRNPNRTQQVRLDRRIEGRVERNGSSGMNDGLTGRKNGQVIGGQAERVLRDIAVQHLHSPAHLGVETVAEFGPEAIERVVADHLTAHSLGCRCPLTGPHDQDDLAARDTSEQALDQSRPEETRGTGHGDASAVQALSDPGALTHASDCLPSGR